MYIVHIAVDSEGFSPPFVWQTAIGPFTTKNQALEWKQNFDSMVIKGLLTVTTTVLEIVETPSPEHFAEQINQEIKSFCIAGHNSKS